MTPVEILRDGGVVGMPTETVYGLAASIRSEKGLREIFHIKNRPFFDPLIVHISSISQLSEVVLEVSERMKFLAAHFWPGPLTMVVEKNPQLNPLITAGLSSVGVRMPRNNCALRLIEELGHPVAAPSANRFGRVSPTTADHVRTEFPDAKFPIIDGGSSEVGVESTVIDLTQKKIRILRPGAIDSVRLERTLEESAFADSLPLKRVESEASPGHLKNHYQPESPLVLVDSDKSVSDEVIRKKLDLSESIEAISLELGDDPQLYARRMYSDLRELSAPHRFLIVRKLPHQTGPQWEAIWDRLSRAASLLI